jgi:pimeloyl-ACP methyl ester carboxylesterase
MARELILWDMPIAEVNGQRLYHEVHGDGEPLLCVAGLTCDTLVWIPQIQAFAESHRTVIFDNRDAGQSSMAGGEYEIADMARDALALADHLELDTFHLLGVSMGGAIAQEIALQAPERVQTLTLAVTFPAGGTYACRLGEVWSRRVAEVSYEQHVDELMLLNHSEGFYDHPEMVEFIRTAMLNNPHPQPPEAFARQIAACGRHDTRDRLRSLTMPTHVIGGEYDILVPVWKSREVASLIPGAKLTVLEGAPHGLSVERADEFNAAVLGFIREAAATQAA